MFPGKKRRYLNSEEANGSTKTVSTTTTTTPAASVPTISEKTEKLTSGPV